MAQSAQINNVKAWHEELMDFMLAQPRAGLKETSEYFGVSMSWLSVVKNSDAFKDAWEKRRENHSSAVSVSLVQRVEALAEVALETMTQRLEREGESIGLSTLREVSETALKSLGFGMRDARAGGSQQAHSITNNNMIVVDRETLARARDARARMQIEQSSSATTQVPSLESATVEQTALLSGLTDGGPPSSEGGAAGGAPLPPENFRVRHELDVSGGEISAKSPDPPPKIQVIDDIPPRRPGNRADQTVLDLFSDAMKGKNKA